MPLVMTLERDTSETSQTAEAAPATLDWFAPLDLPADAQAALDRLEAEIVASAARSRRVMLAVAECVPARGRLFAGEK